jgi:ribosomal protein S12 methylthiotransferase accessory factor
MMLRREYLSRHRDFWVIDVTTDLGIPSFVALSQMINGAPNIIQGYGAHLDPAIALRRAVTEMNQMLAILDSSLQQGPAVPDPDNKKWFSEASVDTEPYLSPSRSLPPTSLREIEDWSTGDLYGDIQRCVSIVAAKGMETLVVNQSRADLGIAVLKVVVPGLRHFWARFGEGRLYEMPVQMGWLPSPLPEDALNPRPISS